ncbi:hypothetical protein [Paractinoplanes durhamensis]|uniref:YokE-like PH domain-containing protein n=1 Tax=Paractinoplanes durhamensis TaxID=113563 RepID=A0ABQ3Z5N6_9ACTN|nr:hypothetical protein [Actinoplanes durhamensis]GIE05142.1 hypothetical protein Adu01nite_64920 [Actinoplanes durhamensis]
MSNVARILGEMPPKERSRIPEGRILELERELGDETVITFTRCHFPFGTLVVTASRIIILLQDGGVDVTRFADIASFSLIEGRKKILGGHSETIFCTQMRDGTRFTGQSVGTDGQWGIHAARQMLAAHETYSLRAR